jgi:hypothetical protein
VPTLGPGSSTNANVRVFRLSLSPCPTYFDKPPNFSWNPSARMPRGSEGIWGSSKALALLRARCLVLKEHSSRFHRTCRPTSAWADPRAQKTADSQRQRQTTVPRLPRRIDRLGALLCELFERARLPPGRAEGRPPVKVHPAPHPVNNDRGRRFRGASRGEDTPSAPCLSSSLLHPGAKVRLP